MEHTPAPWATTRYSNDFGVYPENEQRRGQDVALVRGDDSEAEANARLIAAAPDLLEACQWAMGFLTGVKCDNEEQRRGLFDKLSAAIAKAEGAD
jgi:hypothetical protein